MMSLKMDKLYYKLKQDLESHEFQVGILEDRPAAVARPKEEGLKNYAGGPARKVKGYSETETLSGILKKIDLSHNILLAPWRNTENYDVVKMISDYLSWLNGKASDIRRVENAVQAVVRNPILRGEYGDNSAETEEKKGFNRLFIDTATLFKNIKARVVKVLSV